jgi:cobalt-zinc-cadmium efflux system outer membrane protein
MMKPGPLRMAPTRPLGKLLAACVALTATAVGSSPCIGAEAAARATAVVFRPDARVDLVALTNLVIDRSPSLQTARLDQDLAAAEVAQSLLWENPAFDASWSTIPLGETNPPGMPSPLADIPSYGVGVSYRFLIGKRGPRQERARALQAGARAARDAAARSQALGLVRVLGSLALATLRRGGAAGIVDDARRSLELARARLDATFGTPLDVDRLQIELSRVHQQVLRADGDMGAARAACASVVGMRCEGFGGAAAAREFLLAWVVRGERASEAALGQRPDIRALEAYGRAAQAEVGLARAMSIPDPTVRLGYLHDRFVVAGNQQISLSLAVLAPLPVFDHGQAAAMAAAAKRDRLAAQRARLLDAARARVPALRLALEAQRRRRQAIAGEMLPRARAVLQDLERAAGNRLVALTDVIQARRTVHELLVEETDSIGDAFEASVELLVQLPDASATAVPAGPGGATDGAAAAKGEP